MDTIQSHIRHLASVNMTMIDTRTEFLVNHIVWQFGSALDIEDFNYAAEAILAELLGHAR